MNEAATLADEIALEDKSTFSDREWQLIVTALRSFAYPDEAPLPEGREQEVKALRDALAQIVDSCPSGSWENEHARKALGWEHDLDTAVTTKVGEYDEAVAVIVKLVAAFPRDDMLDYEREALAEGNAFLQRAPQPQLQSSPTKEKS